MKLVRHLRAKFWYQREKDITHRPKPSQVATSHHRTNTPADEWEGNETLLSFCAQFSSKVRGKELPEVGGAAIDDEVDTPASTGAAKVTFVDNARGLTKAEERSRTFMGPRAGTGRLNLLCF